MKTQCRHRSKLNCKVESLQKTKKPKNKKTSEDILTTYSAQTYLIFVAK